MGAGLRSALWPVLGLLAAALATAAFLGGPRLLHPRHHPAGEGLDIAAHGFDLSAFRLDRSLLAASGQPPDGLRALDNPPHFAPADADAWNAEHRGKYLVGSDRVIGIAWGGQARAYPLRVLNWHEIANDTLGGIPVAVTYNPLCDAAVVFDRRLEGETLRLAFSGLLYNSNLLAYDTRPERSRCSLWSQLLFRAVSGPRAGRELKVLPASLARWDAWRAAHPETTVLDPDPGLRRLYKRDPYAPYFGDERLRFPVRPLPAPEQQRKQRVLALVDGERTRVWTHSELASLAADDGRLSLSFRDRQISARWDADPGTVLVEELEPDAGIGVVHAFYFAWNAFHPRRSAASATTAPSAQTAAATRR